MPERRAARWVWLVSALVPAASAGAAYVWLGERTFGASRSLLVAAALLGLSALVVVPTRSGVRMYGSYGVVAALPFVFEDVRVVDLQGVAGALAAGLALEWVIWTLQGHDQRQVLARSIRQGAGFAMWLVVFDAAGSIPLLSTLSFTAVDVIRLALGGTAWFAVEVAVRALLGLGPRQLSRRYLALQAARDLDAFISLVGAGALFGLAWPFIRWWALSVSVLPYSFAHSSFWRYDAVKRTYRQTIRALARIPEQAGLGFPGHAERTTDLSLAIAKELGVRPALVDEVEYTAFMHDIGRITLTEASVIRAGFTEDDIAQWGSEIIGATDFLTDVATYVRRQYEPYRKPGEQRDPDVPLVSRIVRAASAYDRSVIAGRSPLEAVEELHRGSVYDYDPDVVASLRRLLDARGVFSHPSKV